SRGARGRRAGRARGHFGSARARRRGRGRVRGRGPAARTGQHQQQLQLWAGSPVIRFFLYRPMLVHVITIAVLAIGLLVVSRSQREGFPAVTINSVVVTTILPGASPEDVESKITAPIEEAIREVDGVEEFSSTSQDGLSIVNIDLYEDLRPREVEAVERDLQKAIDAIQDFPDELDAPPVLSRFNPAKMSVLEIALTGPTDAVLETIETLR